MAETISQYQIAPFTTPQNGQPGDADQVRGNDNTVGTSHNSHDADSGVHFQSSLLANRPAAGTAGRKWYTTDTKRAFYDTGSAWDEFGYLPLSGGTVTGALTVTGTLAGTTSLSLQSTGANAISFTTNGTSRWSIGSGGSILATTDGAYDIGQAGANRPRHLYVQGDVAVTGGFQQSASSGAFVVSTTGTVSLASSNASPLVVDTTAGQLQLKASGATGQIFFYTNATSRWLIDSSGHLRPGGSNTYDLGASSAPVKDIYTGTVKVSNTQVIGARQTGWVAATGTATRSTFATGSVTLSVLAEHVKALIDDLTTHGLIGA